MPWQPHWAYSAWLPANTPTKFPSSSNLTTINCSHILLNTIKSSLDKSNKPGKWDVQAWAPQFILARPNPTGKSSKSAKPLPAHTNWGYLPCCGAICGTRHLRPTTSTTTKPQTSRDRPTTSASPLAQTSSNKNCRPTTAVTQPWILDAPTTKSIPNSRLITPLTCVAIRSSIVTWAKPD